MRFITYEIVKNTLLVQYQTLEPVVDFGDSVCLTTLNDVTESHYIKDLFDIDNYIIYNAGNQVDVDILDASNIEDNSIGTIFFIDVLEHIANPFKASEEIYRILKPGGLLFVSAPWEFPYQKANDDIKYLDYFRYTPHALQSIFNDFKINEVDWEPRDDELTYLTMDRFGQIVGLGGEHPYFVTGCYLIAHKPL